MIILKIILLIILGIIVFQDIKERAVWWILFPLFLIAAGYLNFLRNPEGMFFIFSFLNFLILGVILGISFLYAKFKMNVNFINGAFGIGDLLFFIALTLAFPTVTFIVVLVFCLIFSLVLHSFLAKAREITVPLAGYSALFLILIYSSHWMGIFKNLYYL